MTLAELLAEAKRLDREATKVHLHAAGGYLTTRRPDGGSFSRSIFHLNELGREEHGPFQAIPFARSADAAKLAFAWNALPRLVAVAEAAVDVVDADESEGWCRLVDARVALYRAVRGSALASPATGAGEEGE